jgi:hypothetical protein
MVDAMSTAHTLMVSNPFTMRPDFLAQSISLLKIVLNRKRTDQHALCFRGASAFNIVLVRSDFIHINFLDMP